MSFEAGIISLNQSGRVMTSHFSTALFTGEPGANKFFYVASGDLTLSDGFAASLGNALLLDHTLRFDLASSANMEIIADVDDLFVLAAALKELNLPLADFFEGSGTASITLNEPDPSKLAQLGLLGHSELLNIVTAVNVSGGSGDLELPVGLYKSGFDVSGFDGVTIVGSGEEIQKFLATSDVPASLSSKIVEYKVVSGDLYIEASRFLPVSTDTTLFTASGNDEFDPAEVIVYGAVVDFDGTGIVFGARITTEGSYGVAFAQVRDTATNITAAHVDNLFSSGLIDNLDIICEHQVKSASDTITTKIDFEDYIIFDPAAITDGALFELVSDFDIGLDTLSFALLTGYDNEIDRFGVGTVSQDFTFIDSGQDLGNLSAFGAGDKPRVEIRISQSSSTHIEFNGLAGSYELDQGPEVSPDFTIILPNDVASDLDVFNFNGIPFNDEITIDDFFNTAVIPDSELERFEALTVVADNAEEAYFFAFDHFYDLLDISSTRTDLVVFTANPDGDELYGDEGSDFLAGGSGNDIIFGDIFDAAGDDVIEGSAGNDFISGDGGDDNIDGGEGDDWIEGGIGNDEIYGGAGNDVLIGNLQSEIGEFYYGDKDYIQGDAGDDLIFGKYDDDVIDGGSGNDTIFAGDGYDAVWGGDGNDFIDGGDHDDDLNGEAGNDTIYGGGGWDNLDGGAGNDELYGEDGEDYIGGGSGNDYLDGGSDNSTDVLLGGEGDGTLRGGGGDDDLEGHDGNDYLEGADGDDTLDGDKGIDTLDGGDGNDTLDGGDGDDYLDGGPGADRLYGGEGDDYLLGGIGNDTVGNTDTLDGGAGDDLLSGGDGDDAFTFTSKNGTSILTDFENGSVLTEFEGREKFQFGLDFFGYTAGTRYEWEGLADRPDWESLGDQGIFFTYASNYTPSTSTDYWFGVSNADLQPPFYTTYDSYFRFPTVQINGTHVHLLAAYYTAGNYYTSVDWTGSGYTLSGTLYNTLPLLTVLAGTAQQLPKDQFADFLTESVTGPNWSRQVTFSKFTTTLTKSDITGGSKPYTKKAFASRIFTETTPDGTGVYAAFGIVGNALVMATIHNGDTRSISASEIFGLRTVAVFSTPSGTAGMQPFVPNSIPIEVFIT